MSSVTEDVLASSLGSGSTVPQTGMLPETESKPLGAWYTAGPALRRKRTIISLSERELALTPKLF